MSIDIKWLEETILKRSVSEVEQKALQYLRERQYKTGDTIVEQGKPGGQLYILRSGKASVEDNDSNTGRIRIASVDAGAMFGELTFMNNHSTTAEVVAREDCIVYKLSRDDFSKLMHERELGFAIFTAMLENQANIIRTMNAQMVPVLQKLAKKAASLPTFVKIFALIFILVYLSAFIFISFKDFAY